jgi:hypothetical protein
MSSSPTTRATATATTARTYAAQAEMTIRGKEFMKLTTRYLIEFMTN